MHAVRLLLALAAFSLAAAAGAQSTDTQSTETQSTDTQPNGNQSADIQPAVSPDAVFNLSFLSTVEVGLTGGYAGGGSGQVSVGRADLIGPLGVRLSLGRSSSDQPLPGGGQARRTLFSSGLDATYALGQPVPGVATSVYGGLRYAQLTSRLSGLGQQPTEATSSTLGMGAGAQISYLLTNAFSFIAELGLDQYFGSGTDASQKSQTTLVAERPGTVFKALLGVKYRF